MPDPTDFIARRHATIQAEYEQLAERDAEEEFQDELTLGIRTREANGMRPSPTQEVLGSYGAEAGRHHRQIVQLVQWFGGPNSLAENVGALPAPAGMRTPRARAGTC
jgi:hypothetical protein